jgi:hypothetical protein
MAGNQVGPRMVTDPADATLTYDCKEARRIDCEHTEVLIAKSSIYWLCVGK